jgi:hypothetical protein
MTDERLIRAALAAEASAVQDRPDGLVQVKERLRHDGWGRRSQRPWRWRMLQLGAAAAVVGLALLTVHGWAPPGRAPGGGTGVGNPGGLVDPAKARGPGRAAISVRGWFLSSSVAALRYVPPIPTGEEIEWRAESPAGSQVIEQVLSWVRSANLVAAQDQNADRGSWGLPRDRHAIFQVVDDQGAVLLTLHLAFVCEDGNCQSVSGQAVAEVKERPAYLLEEPSLAAWLAGGWEGARDAAVRFDRGGADAADLGIGRERAVALAQQAVSSMLERPPVQTTAVPGNWTEPGKAGEPTKVWQVLLSGTRTKSNGKDVAPPTTAILDRSSVTVMVDFVTGKVLAIRSSSR